MVKFLHLIGLNGEGIVTPIKKVLHGRIVEEDDCVCREPSCFVCKNLIQYPLCRAFIDIIPIEVRLVRSDHSLPLSELPGYTGKLERIDETTGKPIIFEPFPKR